MIKYKLLKLGTCNTFTHYAIHGCLGRFIRSDPQCRCTVSHTDTDGSVNVYP